MRHRDEDDQKGRLLLRRAFLFRHLTEIVTLPVNVCF
jgi:hypothetical protein